MFISTATLSVVGFVSVLVAARDGLGYGVVAAAVALVCLAIELPTRLYAGVFIGEGRQAELALCLAVSDAVRWGGTIAVCAIWSSAVMALSWHLMVLLFLCHKLRRSARGARGEKPTIDVPFWLQLGRQALLPLATATAAGAARIYADRVVASTNLSLSEAGVYAAAFTSTGVLALLSTQVSAALIPRLTQQYAHGGARATVNTLGTASGVIGVVTTTGGLLIIFVLRQPVAELLGFTGVRGTLFESLLPVAVTVTALAALSGPAYSAIAAAGRFGVVAALNSAGLLSGLLVLATGTLSPERIAASALLSSAIAAGGITVISSGPRVMVPVRLMASQLFVLGWITASITQLRSEVF